MTLEEGPDEGKKKPSRGAGPTLMLGRNVNEVNAGRNLTGFSQFTTKYRYGESVAGMVFNT